MNNLASHLVKPAAIALFLSLCMLLTGCGLTPSYTVRVENESSKAVLARIERRPSMNNMIVLDSGRVNAGGSRVFGPVEAPPLERVYIVIQSPENLHSLPESHKITRGSWVVTVSRGSMESWGAYEISVSKE
jgi:hypothetical protein